MAEKCCSEMWETNYCGECGRKIKSDPTSGLAIYIDK